MQERVLKEQLLPCRREPNDLTDPPNIKRPKSHFFITFWAKPKQSLSSPKFFPQRWDPLPRFIPENR